MQANLTYLRGKQKVKSLRADLLVNISKTLIITSTLP